MREVQWLEPTEPAGTGEDLIEAGPRRPPPLWTQRAGRAWARIQRAGWFALVPLGLIVTLLVGPAVGSPGRPEEAVPFSQWQCEQRAVRVVASAPHPGLLVEYLESVPSGRCTVVRPPN